LLSKFFFFCFSRSLLRPNVSYMSSVIGFCFQQNCTNRSGQNFFSSGFSYEILEKPDPEKFLSGLGKIFSSAGP
jgi:hypothetical protein